ncbi:hypothetical protein [Roseomonas sp. CECT 9278]|uniref:hypothetical protein n=1 Tax=Roseomonas sp. CECT 9278 TaxID=2845823 RepID=UPI001E5E9C3F|nr:hypothetical protein [Roseomonas sp. CECT 9278]CAH0287771.1 hypothetical protein ROS9278_04136 [Roseomonas sp. CECT 9278]
MPNVAIVFFGMARSTRWTIDSIRRRVYLPNDRPGLSITRFASLNIVDRIDNRRSGENGVELPKCDQFLLDCDAYLNVSQRDDDIADLLERARQRRDVYKDDWRSIRNLLHQLLSLKRAWQHIRMLHGTSFDHFVFLRPDLQYLDPIDITEAISRFTQPNSIAIPAWQSYEGLNDRFAIADAVAARAYANRIDRVVALCRQRALHSETLLRFVMTAAQCHVLPLAARARRVRADGRMHPETFAPPGSDPGAPDAAAPVAQPDAADLP